MINFGRIESDIFVGSAPQSSVDVARLSQMKINAVLSLQSDMDFQTHQIDWKKVKMAYAHNRIEVERYAILDFDETDVAKHLAKPVNALNNLLAQKRRVYVHCNAGISRAPATVLAYLCHFRGMSVDEGLEYIRLNRPQAYPYIKAVEKVLDDLKKPVA